MDETDGQAAAATTVAQAPAGARTRRRFDEAFRRLSVETWQTSGLNAADFCRREGLNAKSFARWRSQILGSDATADDDDPVHHAPPAFVPVMVTTGAGAASPDATCSSLNAGIAVGSAGIEVVLHKDRRVRVARDFDQATLRRVVQVLESIGDGETPRC